MSELTAAQEASLKKQGVADASSPASPVGVTAVEDALKGYGRKVVTLPFSGWVVEIEALGPGDYYSVYGTALDDMMTSAGLEKSLNDDKARKKFREGLDAVQKCVLMEERTHNNRRLVVKAVRSMPLSMARQADCPPGVMSVLRIADAELSILWTEISKLSGWSRDLSRFQGTVDDAEDE